MREIRQVRLLNKGKPTKNRLKPKRKCSANFKAREREPVQKVKIANAGLSELDKQSKLPDLLYASKGFSECCV